LTSKRPVCYPRFVLTGGPSCTAGSTSSSTSRPRSAAGSGNRYPRTGEREATSGRRPRAITSTSFGGRRSGGTIRKRAAHPQKH